MCVCVCIPKPGRKLHRKEEEGEAVVARILRSGVGGGETSVMHTLLPWPRGGGERWRWPKGGWVKSKAYIEE